MNKRNKQINALAILIILSIILCVFYSVSCFRIENFCAQELGTYGFTHIGDYAYCIDVENETLVRTNIRWHW